MNASGEAINWLSAVAMLAAKNIQHEVPTSKQVGSTGTVIALNAGSTTWRNR